MYIYKKKKKRYYVLTFSEFESVKQLYNSAQTRSKSYLTAQHRVNLSFHMCVIEADMVQV